jgi:S1-C subfamily serine protease
MFSKACQIVREYTYGFMGASVVTNDGTKSTVNITNGTAFMVSPGYLLTAAHGVHQNSNKSNPTHQSFEIIRTPDIGGKMQKAIFVAEDVSQDIALLRIEDSENNHTASLVDSIIPRGTNCGFLGFPLANVQFSQDGSRRFNLTERFQGAYISSYVEQIKDDDTKQAFYEIDSLMYSGSSGCPAFTIEGRVIGMQVASIMHKQKDEDKAERIAISIVIPSSELIKFLKAQGILTEVL